MATFLNITSKQARFIVESIRDSAEQHGFTLKDQALLFVEHLESIGKQADSVFHEFKDIDFLKDVSLELQYYSNETASEYDNIVSDMIFSIENQYQAYYGLNENNWGKVA